MTPSVAVGIIVVIFALTLGHQSWASNSQGRTIFRRNHREETYVFFQKEDEKTDFNEAMKACSKIGHPVHVRDAYDQYFLGNLTDGHQIWLGSKLHDGSFFRQPGLIVFDPKANGSTFHNWDTNEPRCYSQCCGVQMRGQFGKWEAQSCSFNAHVLCRLSDAYANALKNGAISNQTTTNTNQDDQDESKDLDMAISNATVETLAVLAQKVIRLEKEVKELRQDLQEAKEEAVQAKEEVGQIQKSLKDMGEQFQRTILSLEKLILNNLPESVNSLG